MMCTNLCINNFSFKKCLSVYENVGTSVKWYLRKICVTEKNEVVTYDWNIYTGDVVIIIIT